MDEIKVEKDEVNEIIEWLIFKILELMLLKNLVLLKGKLNCIKLKIWIEIIFEEHRIWNL